MKTITLISFILLLTLSKLTFAQLNDAVKFRIIDPDGHTDETILRLHNSATSNWDDDWDAWKLFTTNPNYPSIYSKSAEEYPLAINSMDFTQKDTICGMWISTPVFSGVYTLEVEFQGVFTNTIQIGIKDVLTGDHFVLNNDAIFQFDVIADAVNDHERFLIYLSPNSEVNVFENDAEISNAGASNWTCSLFTNSGTLIDNITVPSQSTTFFDLSDDAYYSVIVDDFGFVDTVYFNIDFLIEEPTDTTVETHNEDLPIEVENENSGISESEKNETQVGLTHSANQYYITGNFDQPENTTIFIYTFDGRLLAQDFYSNTTNLNYALPENLERTNGIIITVYVSDEKFNFKLIY